VRFCLTYSVQPNIMQRYEIVKHRPYNAVAQYLVIKFWGSHPTRNQDAITAVLDFCGNIARAMEDRSIVNYVKVKYFTHSWSKFWSILIAVTGITPHWYEAEQCKNQINDYQHEIASDTRLIKDYERKINSSESNISELNDRITYNKNYHYKPFWIIFWIICGFGLGLMIYLIHGSKRSRYNRIADYEEDIDSENKLINEFLRLIDENESDIRACEKCISDLRKEIEAHKNNSIEASREISIEKHGLNFIPYRDFMTNDSYNGSAVYIMYFINTDKYYVGQTVNLITRQHQHVSWSRGITKNENFPNINIDDILIAYITCDESKLDDVESEWIAKTNSFHNGYNKTIGNNTGLRI